LAELKSINGIYNKRLTLFGKKTPGWIFSKKKRDKPEGLLVSVSWTEPSGQLEVSRQVNSR
jgi:hypothetical protein